MKRETKELLTVIGVTSTVVITAGTVMAFFMSGILVLQIIATVIIVATLIYGVKFYSHDCNNDDFRG